MANWAIVIGINEYWNPAANLRGAVDDALKMVGWLTNQKGGDVPPQNLCLLTRPTPPPSTFPLHPRIVKRDATYDDVVEAGIDLVNKSGGQGERFFFYFSGHGLINHMNFVDESVMVLADFSNVHPEKSITISSVREYFGNTAFTEQFFFFDACRNMLDWKREFRVGEFPLPGESDPARLQSVSQCVLSATSPGLRAIELNERGAFTEVLLAGLGGAGKAKIYDKDKDEYLVRADRLFAYVKEEVSKKKILVTEPPAPALYQSVYPEIKNVTVQPTLAHIPRNAVDTERLELYIEPDGLWTQTTVKVRLTSEDAEYDKEIAPINGVPVEFPPAILPMFYTVRVEASGFRPEKRRWPFELYEPKRLDVRLIPNPSPSGQHTEGGVIDVNAMSEDMAFGQRVKGAAKDALSAVTSNRSLEREGERENAMDNAHHEANSVFDESDGVRNASVGASAGTSTGRSRMVTGMFRDRDSAEKAYSSINSRGYSKDDVNVLMGDETRKMHFSDDAPSSELGDKALEGAGVGSAIGGTVGAVLAAIAAIGTSVALPGIGLVVAGPLAAALAGAGAGGLTGGLVGALVGSGIPEDRAREYEAGVKEGGIVMGINPRNDEDADYFSNEFKTHRGESIYRDTQDLQVAVTVKNIDHTPIPAQLIVKATDILAPLEVTDNAGTMLKAGHGSLTITDLKPGFYRARLVTPEGQATEEVIELSSGERETVLLAAPQPPNAGLFKTIVDNTKFYIKKDDHTLHLSESIGAMATAQLTTMLTLVGSIVDERYGWGPKTEGLSLKSFRDETPDGTTSGLRVICADETVPAEGVTEHSSKSKVRFWLQEQAIPSSFDTLAASAKIAALSQFTSAASPGTYWLSLELPERNPVVFPVAVLSNRLMLLVVHLSTQGSVRVFNYSPSLDLTEFPGEKAVALRRLELMQRFYLNGQLEHAYQNAPDLHNAKLVDPLAGCLSGYTMLKLGKAAELDVVARYMVNNFGELSDSFVLMAEHLTTLNNIDAAADAYRTALSRGVPLFADGLVRLLSGVQKHHIEHHRVELIKEVYMRRARGLLWSAWTPTDFSPVMPLLK